MSFLAELKRRNVYQVAVLYLVASWLILQVTDVLSSILPVPDWTGLIVFILLVVGFPLVLIFAWVYELTPEGIRREREVPPDSSITARTGRRINLLTTLLLVTALAVMAIDWLALGPPAADVGASGSDPRSMESLEDHPALPATAPGPEHSIAVLPFVNMSPEPEQVYFSEGLSEELLNLLTRIDQLRVAARTSSFSFRGKDVDIATIAERLNVAHVLEGSVRKAGNRIRVTAQLIDAGNGYHVWSDTWERELEDVFEIQDEIAAAVVRALKVELLGETPRHAAVDPDAYALFLQARHLLDSGSLESADTALGLLDEALAIEPGFARAWSETGRAWSRKMQRLEDRRDERLFVHAMQAYETAISLDPEHALSYSRMGFMRMHFAGDIEEAARLVERGLALEPGDPRVQANAGNLLDVLGRFEEAILLYKEVILRDPLAAVNHHNLGLVYLRAERFAEAVDAFRRALALSPDSWGVNGFLALALYFEGDYAASREALAREPMEHIALAGRAMLHYATGNRAASDAALAELKERYSQVVAVLIAVAHSQREEPDEALRWLETAYERDGRAGLLFAVHGPALRVLHSDPRWEALVRRAGLSPEQLAEIPFDVTLPGA